MPYDQVMHKFGQGTLHSGSAHGPKVKSRKQAIAIMMSEKRAAQGGKTEYKSRNIAGNSMHTMVTHTPNCTVIDPKNHG